MQRPASPVHAASAIGRNRDAHAWLARADKVVVAKNARLFNPAVARLLALPPAESWRALTARARDGDVAAAAAALLLAGACDGHCRPRKTPASSTI